MSKYKRFTPSGCTNIGIRTSTPFFCFKLILNYEFKLDSVQFELEPWF